MTLLASHGMRNHGGDAKDSIPRVLIVADNASDSFGGEAALPLRYFRLLRERGVMVWLLTHARVQQELLSILPAEVDRMYFVKETAAHRLLWRLGNLLDRRLQHFTIAFLLRALTQSSQRRIATRLVEQLGINVVHQPTPASPREPSLLYNLGAPVIIGPMNGNMSYPPSFKHEEPVLTRLTILLGRALAGLLNTLFPGKKQASMLLVANDRSRRALVRGTAAQVRYLSENGVDTNIWKYKGTGDGTCTTCRFAFVGRLIPSKGVDLWLQALDDLIQRGVAVSATIIGDGPERSALEDQARCQRILGTESGENGKVSFAGHRRQSEIAEMLTQHDCLVLPTLIESGGAVLLEGMAVGLPVISTDWGGPADYIDEDCGILVPLSSRENLVCGLAEAMERLALDPELRMRMGQAGRRKIEQQYTWAKKIDQVIQFYRDVVDGDVPRARVNS